MPDDYELKPYMEDGKVKYKKIYKAKPKPTFQYTRKARKKYQQYVADRDTGTVISQEKWTRINYPEGMIENK